MAAAGGASAAPLATVPLLAVGWPFRLKDSPGLAPAPAGAPLTLVRDRANQYDVNAIRVVCGAAADAASAYDIGFIEKAVAKALAPLVFDDAAAAACVRLDARSGGLAASGKVHTIVLRVLPAGGGAGVPARLRDALLKAFAATHAPPLVATPARPHLRSAPDSSGWVHMPRGVSALEWCAANLPSSFDGRSVAFVYAGAPNSEAHERRCGKWCVRSLALAHLGGRLRTRAAQHAAARRGAAAARAPDLQQKRRPWCTHADAAAPAARTFSPASPCVRRMVFVSPAQQDDSWSCVVSALAAGTLGCAAKTPPPNADDRRGRTVLIVYTRDWEDRADVLRVGLALKEVLSVRCAISYKTDVCVARALESHCCVEGPKQCVHHD
jgi:hypothetical protein